SSIPIVFATAADPVGNGLVASLARPGGNVTGLSVQNPDIAGKRIELLQQLVPGFRRLAILANIDTPGAMVDMREVQAAGHAIGLDITTSEIRRSEDIAPAFEEFKPRVEALFVVGDPLTFVNRVQISALALAARMPTICAVR